MAPSTGTKLAPEPTRKYAGLVYPEESKSNPSVNPDNFPLWKVSTSWKKVTAEFVTITPEVAKKMLAYRNPKNEVRTKPSWINTLRFRMDNGKWALMETIEFDWDGHLGNGHHRLEAIAGSNAAVVMLVVTGLNPENYYRYDDNYKRTSDNVLAMYLEKLGYSTTEAKSAAKICAPATSWTILFWNGENLESRRLIEKEERLDIVELRPDILQSYKDVKRLLKKHKTKADVGESVLVALLTLGSEVNKTRAMEFIEGIISGDDGSGRIIKEGDPRWLYRKFLKENKDTKGKNRVYTHFKLIRGLQAMREYLENAKMKGWPRGTQPDVPRLSEQQDKFFAEMAAEEAKKRTAEKRLKAMNGDTAAAAAAA